MKDAGHSLLNPALPDDDFEDAVWIAQAEFDQHHPGTDHRLAEPEPLARMLEACEAAAGQQVGGLMEDMPDSQMELIYSLYEGLRLKGPGSEASTLKAFSMLHGLPPAARIVDFGCGAGAASLVLAKATHGSVTAVDIHQPFLDELDTLAVHDGLAGQIKTVHADMGDPPFPDEAFDLVWSEGAIYNIGFEEGLRRWRRLLPQGGFVAVTEATWLSETPRRKATEFWAAEYPAMTSIEDNLTKVGAAGFDPIGHFALPSEDWKNFYWPLEARLATFRSKHLENTEAQVLANGVQREIDIWKEFGSSYGYVFYLGKAI